jgi:hypothetical protein
MLVIACAQLCLGWQPGKAEPVLAPFATTNMERTNTIYKDVRFWLVIISISILIYMTLKSYPVE